MAVVQLRVIRNQKHLQVIISHTGQVQPITEAQARELHQGVTVHHLQIQVQAITETVHLQVAETIAVGEAVEAVEAVVAQAVVPLQEVRVAEVRVLQVVVHLHQAADKFRK